MAAWLKQRSSELTKSERWLLLLLAASTLARIVYGLAIADPASGPDAPTYELASQIFADKGFFAAAPGIPYWPAGYPGFVSFFHWVFGTGRAFVVGQVLILSVAIWCSYRVIRRILGNRVAVVAAVGLCLSPALTGTVVTYMYEFGLLAGLVIGADLVLTAEESTGRRRTVCFVLGGLVVGAFSMMQATIVPPALALAGVSLWRMRQQPARRAVLATAFVLALLVGPAILVARNVHRGDGFGFAGNLGITMQVGEAGAGRTNPCGTTDHTVEGDRELTRCMLAHKLKKPVQSLRVAADIEWKLWAPMVGPLSKYGSWYHAFNFRRAVPDFLKSAPWFDRVDRWASKAWTVGTIGLVVGGMVLAFRRERDRMAVLWLAAPVLLWVLMHSVIAGDARFRLAVAPFYVAFMAYAAVWAYDRVSVRRGATRVVDAPAGLVVPNR